MIRGKLHSPIASEIQNQESSRNLKQPNLGKFKGVFVWIQESSKLRYEIFKIYKGYYSLPVFFPMILICNIFIFMAFGVTQNQL